MNLTEYLTQRQIEKQPDGSVYLDVTEYKILDTIERLHLQLVLLIQYGYTYVYKTGKYDSEALWTMDDFGHPKQASVFAIKKNKNENT